MPYMIIIALSDREALILFTVTMDTHIYDMILELIPSFSATVMRGGPFWIFNQHEYS
jgi:hypothetical protein